MNYARVLVLLLCIALLPTVSSAQSTGAEVSTAAPQSFITEYSLPSEKLARSEALYQTRLAMYVIGTVYGILILIAVLALKVAPKFRDLAERVSSRRFVQALVFAPLLLLTCDVLRLPLSIYGHYLRVEYGLSVQSFGSWLGDWLKNEGVNVVIGTLIVWGVYSVFRKSPTRWWLYGWLASIPFILLLVLVQPIFIDPLFNTFAPLEAKQPQLLDPLEQVMQRGGIAIDRSRMFEMEASEKVTTYNAYVTGIGASKRVVVWDNTARDLSVPETLFVFGHEQGHYALHHIWMILAFQTIGLLIAAYIAYRVIHRIPTRFKERWQIRELSDWASLPVLLLLLNLMLLMGTPINSAFTRVLEHQADTYGLEVIHGLVPDSSQAAAHAFQKLGEKSLAYPEPHPLYVLMAYTHPPLRDRVQYALSYKPWERGGARFIQDRKMASKVSRGAAQQETEWFRNRTNKR